MPESAAELLCDELEKLCDQGVEALGVDAMKLFHMSRLTALGVEIMHVDSGAAPELSEEDIETLVEIFGDDTEVKVN